MYHNDPHPDDPVADPVDVDVDVGVDADDAALGVIEGDLEEEEEDAVAVAVAVDLLEEGARGPGAGLGPPGQRHIEDFLEEYVAAPVTQKPCLC